MATADNACSSAVCLCAALRRPKDDRCLAHAASAHPRSYSDVDLLGFLINGECLEATFDR